MKNKILGIFITTLLITASTSVLANIQNKNYTNDNFLGTKNLNRDLYDYGDAPEDALAYPYSGVMGAFPTCISCGPSGWVQHNNFGAWFGPSFDFELEGNGGFCPTCFPPYDQDECFIDNDAGLILPDPFTIDNMLNIIPCPAGAGIALGSVGQTAVWGVDIDIDVHNTMPGHPEYLPAYVNLIVDWGQNGMWGDPGEHVLQNFVVPPLYIGPLSALNPPNFVIGPNSGYVWVRFSITEAPVYTDWNGEGIFEDGESEDYLFLIDDQPFPIEAEKQVWNDTLGDWDEYINAEICTNVAFRLSIYNLGVDPVIVDKIWDVLPPCVEYNNNATINGNPQEPDVISLPTIEWNFILPADYWYPGSEPNELPPGEWIIIEFDVHVIGPACTDNINWGYWDVFYDDEYYYYEDSAIIHPIEIEEPWENHKMHFPQLPDPNGWDILDTFPWVMLADDWMCSETGYVTYIHFWGSWLSDIEGNILGFYISIFSDIPADQSPTGYSMPGDELWSSYITEFDTVYMDPSPQGWYDPIYYWWQHPNHNFYYRYDITDIPEPFYQENETIYWLSVMADVEDAGEPPAEPPLWGWKTSIDHWNDDAVYSFYDPPFYNWYELYNPEPPYESLDMAFVITGEPGAEEDWYWKSPYSNYAPNIPGGMPDFSQNQNNWNVIKAGANGVADTTAIGDDIQVSPVGSVPGPQGIVVAPGSNCRLDTFPANDDVICCAFCGPVAVANCFWWFDSKYANPNGFPGDGVDEFPLVTDSGVGDDHLPSNVMSVVDDLASKMNTCMYGTTDIDDMQAGIDAALAERDLDHFFEENTYDEPEFSFIEGEIERSQDVILLLGFYNRDIKLQDQIQPIIQYNDNLQPWTWWDYQSFVPTVDRLDAINISLTSNGPPCPIEINVYDVTGTLLGTTVGNPGVLPPQPTWVQFHFDPPIPLISGQLYYFDVREVDVVDNLHYEWFYAFGDAYPPGQGWMDTFLGIPPDGDPFDWTFITEYYPDEIRMDGHYVTCAGVNSNDSKIAFSDPALDISNPAAVDHNDAANVSHDIYNVAIGCPIPYLNYRWWLPNYPTIYDFTIVEQAVIICPRANSPPVFGNPNPSNGSTGNLLTLSWQIPINDPEGDDFDWSIECSNGQSSSGNDDTNGTKTLFLSGLSYSTTYTVWVNASDGFASYTREWFTFTTKANSPPNSPSNPDPYDGETDVDVDHDLSWSCSDPDGDPLTYDVYFGSTSPPPQVSWGQSATTYEPGTMNTNTVYYWKIVAKDGFGGSTSGPEWDFTTENTPPNSPSNPDPYDGETDVDIDHDLSWSCSDPDGDDLTYDVYFEAGDSTPDVLVSNDQTETTYDPGTMQYETIYYWQIIAEDEHGDTTNGPIWSFTTEEEPELIPDLDCHGNLNWQNVNTGETVTGSFYVENDGDPLSLLDWEIESYPTDWGTWTFSDTSGTDLTPEDGDYEVEVEVVAPNQQETTFTGEIVIVNSEDPDDTCTIDVSLTTPLSKYNINSQVIQFLQKYFFIYIE